MGFLKDAKYPFDLSRLSDGFQASLIPYLTNECANAMDIEESEDGFNVFVGNTTLNMPIDQIPVLMELFIPSSFYDLAVTSDFSEDIFNVVKQMDTVDEFAKFFSVTGSLLAMQNTLASVLYHNRQLAGKNPKIAELISASLRFWDLIDIVYIKLLTKDGFKTDEYVSTQRLMPSMKVAQSFFEEMTDLSPPSGKRFDHRHGVSVAFLLAYQSLYYGLIGSTLTIANLGGQDFKTLLNMSDPEAVEKVLGTLAGSQGALLPNNPDASLNVGKKRYFALLVNFYLFNKYACAHTGYEFQDPFVEAFSRWGEKLYNVLGNAHDEQYIDLSVIQFGHQENNNFEQTMMLHHPILEWNAMSHIHLENNSVVPFALTAAFTMSLWKNEGTEKFFKNPLLKALPEEALENEDEQITETFKIVLAEMNSGTDLVDPYRFYRLALLATYLRGKTSEPARSLLHFTEVYMSALYLAWFRTGKFMRPVRDMDNFGGMEAYETLHKECLMILGTYQHLIASDFQGEGVEKDYYYATTILEKLAQSWLYFSSGEASYFESFSSDIKNIINFVDIESVAVALKNKSTVAAIVEIVGAFDPSVQLVNVVNEYDRKASALEKKRIIDTVSNASPWYKENANELESFVPGSILEARCLLTDGISTKQSVQPLEYATFFVVSAIEKILALWSDKQAVVVDSKTILPPGEAKYLIVRSTFMEGGTLRTLQKEVENFNPLLKG